MTKKTLTLTSASLAAALVWPAAVAAQPGSWQEERAAAVQAYGAGNYGDAEARLLDAIGRAKNFGPRDPRVAATLKAARVMVSCRKDIVRFTPHLYNTPADIDRVLACIDDGL